MRSESFMYYRIPGNVSAVFKINQIDYFYKDITNIYDTDTA